MVRAPRNFTIKGLNMAAQGKIEEARGAFEKALKVDPFDSSAAAGLEIVKDAIGGKIKKETAVHLFKGFDYANKERWNEAFAEADKSIALDPKYVRAYSSRGNLYVGQQAV